MSAAEVDILQNNVETVFRLDKANILDNVVMLANMLAHTPVHNPGTGQLA
jgi:hypothetical protein